VPKRVEGITPLSSYRFDGLFKLLMKRLAVDLGGLSETEVIRVAVLGLARERGIE
jgi:hypothetical protein